MRGYLTWPNGHSSWQVTGWQSGYKGVKAMTLISQTPTYDTFPMTLTSGKPYTARLPLAGRQIIPGVVSRSEARPGRDSSCWWRRRAARHAAARQRQGHRLALGHANGTAP
jgi:hypothetical protein